ncbi:hypothetical protein BDR26DRAFT_309834 [Obelidium mucronatum]|nr:hypothetical protein BDR26DRAFT_309834 [Obelidium mucronatum]
MLVLNGTSFILSGQRRVSSRRSRYSDTVRGSRRSESTQGASTNHENQVLISAENIIRSRRFETNFAYRTGLHSFWGASRWQLAEDGRIFTLQKKQWMELASTDSAYAFPLFEQTRAQVEGSRVIITTPRRMAEKQESPQCTLECEFEGAAAALAFSALFSE